MRANLTAAFGEPVHAGERVYHASPTPEQLAVAPLEAVRAARVGYRDRYIKGVAAAPARREPMRLPGVGPQTADLALIRAARRPDSLFLDVYTRELLSQLYFDGAHVSDEQLRRYGQTRWGRHQRYVGLYLTTNTDAWTMDLGIDLRLRSAALSDPDSPSRARPALRSCRLR